MVEPHVFELHVKYHICICLSDILSESVRHELKQGHPPDIAHQGVEHERVHERFVSDHWVEGHGEESESELYVSSENRHHHVVGE